MVKQHKNRYWWKRDGLVFVSNYSNGTAAVMWRPGSFICSSLMRADDFPPEGLSLLTIL